MNQRQESFLAAPSIAPGPRDVLAGFLASLLAALAAHLLNF